jgi:hypothetical protein
LQPWHPAGRQANTGARFKRWAGIIVPEERFRKRSVTSAPVFLLAFHRQGMGGGDRGLARHFLDEEEMVGLLGRQPGCDETEARSMVLQVQGRDYNPPKRERILAWQAQQEFPICPTPDDPQACNVYRELRFPESVYEQIGEYWEEKAEAQEGA